MVIAHSRVRCLAFQEEVSFASSSLNWDQDIQAGTAFNQAVIEPNVEGLQQEKVPNENSVKRLMARQTGILGLKSKSTVSFNTYLHGSPTTAGDDTQAAEFELSILGKNAMGGQLRSYRKAVGVGSTTTSVTLADTTNLSEGMWHFYVDADTSKGDFGQITGISGATVTIRPGLSFTPASGDVAYACVSNYFDSDSLRDHTDVQHTTLGMYVKGENNEDSYQMRGVKLGMGINALEPGVPSMATWEGGVVSFDNSVEAVNVPALSGAVAGAAPLAVGTGDDSRFYFGPSSGTLVTTPQFSLEPVIGVTHQQVPGATGTEGVYHYIVADAPSEPALNVSLLYSSSFAEDYEALNEKSCLIQIGTAVAKAFCIYYPQLEYGSDPTRGEASNRLTNNLEFIAKESDLALTASITGDSLEALRSAISVVYVA